MNEGMSHPDEETMAAFLDGKLDPGGIADVTGHLAECGDCRTIIGEAARFESEQAAAAHPATRAWRLRAMAAVIAAAAVLLPVARYLQQSRQPLRVLIAAAPRDHRATDARLSDFEWAPRPVAQRGAPAQTPSQLRFGGVAGKVLEENDHKDTAEARHAAGVAHLLIGHTAQSLEKLERAASESKDARVWNDLAAARYSVAVREERKAMLPSALAAASTALRLEPELAEAQFNQALILEASELADEARKAWERYLELDPNSEWSAEARDRLQKLPRDSVDFQKELERAIGDTAALLKLVRAYPQESRKYGESLYLAAWADAEANHDLDAPRLLAEVRAIGTALVAINGNALLADTVATIDRADTTRRAALAEAHRVYRDARRAHAGSRLEQAESLFRQAEAALRANGSPLADDAACRLAAVRYGRNHGAEAVEALARLLPRIAQERHPALAAEVHWQLALCAISAADWGTAAREGTMAAAAFKKLGETEHAAFMGGYVAHALDRVGATELAWQTWTRSFADLRRDPVRKGLLLQSAGFALAATERVPDAEALLDLMLAARSSAKPLTDTTAPTDRARLAIRSGDAANAERWLGEARAAAKRLPPESRAMASAQIDVAESVLRTAGDPHGAIAVLDRAIGFFTEHDGALYLPDAHLQRARAHRAAGNGDAALADYETALRHVEEQRASIGPESQNLAFLDTATPIIDETIELHLERGAVAQAFRVADRAHSLLDAGEVAAIPEGAALLEYVLLPRRVAIFCVTRDGISAVTVNVDRRTVSQRVASLTQKIRGKQDVPEIRAAAAELHGMLIAPVRGWLTDVDELIVVGDRQLLALPFAVLFDAARDRFLAEDYTIRYAPSAASVAGAAAAGLSPAVAIADPDAPDWPDLPHSRTEAADVSAIHGATVIAGREATRARVIEALENSALVHYAGHADSDLKSYGALLLAPSGNDSGILGANDIARLSLRQRAPLVVLSACGTLRGEVTHVAGMPTLARAFLTAGARAVVGTQWEIDDDVTTPLFLQFHKHLREGQAPARALRSAQTWMLQHPEPRYRHPAAWSAVAVLSNIERQERESS